MNLSGRRYGHIRVEKILGKGGMGDVYQGFDETLARRVALKVLHPDAPLDEESRTRVIREARTLSLLDHPNICRIYEFIEDDKADVLVLELIEGRTLEQALRDGLPLNEKLRIARDVASVLVAAHRAGILHRDLKPENVMLTKSGEVKVLDFGLARWVEQISKSGRNLKAISADATPHLHIAEPDERWAALQPDKTAIMDRVAQEAPLPARVNATAYGITVGTPLFMSPEQASGDELTTASDIYSFGLMLQVMFTGRDPYPDGLNARDVMMFAARGNSLPVTGVPHDIGALIKALKAVAPSDRPTAVDALQRIEHIIAAPRRLLRNTLIAIAAALVIFSVWKYTTDLRRAEAEARKRRSQANALIGFMLGDLSKKLEPVGKLDILDDVGQQALDYMSSLDPKTLTPEELVAKSRALSHFGSVRTRQGNLDGAVAAFRTALSLANEAHRREPANPENALAVGTAHFWVGNAWLQKGDNAAALAEMREYRRITEDLAAHYPANENYQLERAYGHSVVAKAMEMGGDLSGSVVEYRLTAKIKKELADTRPDNLELQADLALTLNNLGRVLERLGQLTEARRHYEHEFSIFESLVRDDAKNATWKDRLANSHSSLAILLENLGDAEGALVHRTASIGLYRDLSAHDPANVDWQRGVAVTLQRRGDLFRIRGRLDDAVADLDAAEAQIQAVLSRDSKRQSWLRDQAVIGITHARVLHASGRDAAARSRINESIATLTKVDGKQAKSNLANAYLVLGDCDPAAAQQAWTTAVQLLAKAAALPDPRIQSTYAQALVKLGRVSEAQPIIARVHGTGYRQFDFEQTCK